MLKDEIEKLKSEKEEVRQSKSSFDEEISKKQAALDEQTKRVEILEKNFRGYKDKAMRMIQDANNQRSALSEEKKQLEAKVANLESTTAVPAAAPDAGLAEALKKQEAALVCQLILQLFNTRTNSF